ncbi:ABC transporter ATP-binding protein [uncultured Clostridium sp.]|uniref:ABC transporter ATP-binding protein n=1 Tax=uncultured Clostridium sp. TaxID=59620 RepID=UPI0025DD1394|nr:ABC transporter ATP-binding protein [uncultured Clostridium sp.]
MGEVIKVDNLSKSYNDILVIKNPNIQVNRGRVFGLLGANGAGKSTTIECIIGTKKYDKGSVSILGMNPAKSRKKLFERVGVQFQEANYQSEIRVDELCEETASLYQNTLDWMELLNKFGLSNKIKSSVKKLSGGERQRLFVILALIPNPEVVFLDELTTGLDVKARRGVWKILKDLKRDGVTIFMTSHFMDEVEALCDEICILKDGESVFYGTVSKAVSDSPYDKLEDAYLWYSGRKK